MVKTLHNSKKSTNFDQLPWKGTLRSYVLSPYEARLSRTTLGQLGLPDRFPFSKPKVNWLLHVQTTRILPK